MNIYLLASTILALYLITLFCEIFTNAVEHLGNSFKIHDGALGSIFAAIGTAFPETVLPLIAVFGAYITGSNYDIGKEIGKGAVLGSPFMLSTLAFFLVSFWIIFLSLKKQRTDKIDIDINLFHRDLHYFIFAYLIGVFSAFIPLKFIAFQKFFGIFLLAFYIFYAVKTVKKSCCNDDFCENKCEELVFLKLFKLDEKYRKFLIFVQFVFSALGLIIFAHIFVENIKDISQILNVPAMIISLFLAPVATELPETVNGLVWSTKNKDTLAISNITGAMVFQACIPMSIGILFTDWHFGVNEIANIICVLFSVFFMLFATKNVKNCFSAKIFMVCVLPYIVYFLFLCLKAIRI